MRLILPLILIALMLPYATSDDEPTSEWLIPPDRNIGIVTAVASPPPPAPENVATTQPAPSSACSTAWPA
jgi:hypothetical protein